MQLYMYLLIALFFTPTTAWYCNSPHKVTDCVQSSWNGWKGDKSKFQAKCQGKLVRWGKDSGVKDCGRACFFCSFIKACCDTCLTIKSVKGGWERIRCTDVEMQVKHTFGVKSTDSGSWSRTESWSMGVSAKASADGEVKGINGAVELTAEAKHALTIQTSRSWSRTTTKQTTKTFTQPAKTCSWTWRTTIVDSCGVKTAKSEDFIITTGHSRGNSPCCLPGIEKDSSGKCRPNNSGRIVSLCDRPQYHFVGPRSGRCVEIVGTVPLGSESTDWTPSLQSQAEQWCLTHEKKCVGYMHTKQSSKNTEWHGRPQFCSSINHHDSGGWEYWIKTRVEAGSAHIGL